MKSLEEILETTKNKLTTTAMIVAIITAAFIFFMILWALSGFILENIL